MEPAIHFDDIDKYGEQKVARKLELSAKDLQREEILRVGEVKLDVTGRPGDLEGEYIAEGSVNFVADLLCSRCVDGYPFANHSEFTVRYRPSSGPGVVIEEVELDPDELDVTSYEERLIALRELAIEQIQLSIPMKPLCEESCRGLCPTCGENLNVGNCACAENLADPRWDALKGIRAELDKKKNI